jgi:hypothetical protein
MSLPKVSALQKFRERLVVAPDLDWVPIALAPCFELLEGVKYRP